MRVLFAVWSVLATAGGAVAGPASERIFTWLDGDGVTVFSDRPPESGAFAEGKGAGARGTASVASAGVGDTDVVDPGGGGMAAEETTPASQDGGPPPQDH